MRVQCLVLLLVVLAACDSFLPYSKIAESGDGGSGSAFGEGADGEALAVDVLGGQDLSALPGTDGGPERPAPSWSDAAGPAGEADGAPYPDGPDAQGDPTSPDGRSEPPCIEVNPDKVNFGGKIWGQTSVAPLEMTACGDLPVKIFSIEMEEHSSPEYDVDLSALDHEPSPGDPVVVPANGMVIVNVTYTPSAESPVDSEGNVILDTGEVLIHSNASSSPLIVPTSGAAVCLCCPTAILKVDEGDEVAPQTILHLNGEESYAPNGAIQKWEWSVEQPVGSASVFVPSFTFPNPTFEANVAGVYKFYLTVYDDTNTPSCFPAQYEVVVIPDEAIHVELLWSTPQDPDETDSGPDVGSDLDLHFLHPYAAGPDMDGDGTPDGWFDIPFDAFWFNPKPNWGSFDPAVADDPSLDRDDTDGAGPENLNLDIPEQAAYRVGVHYWNDHGYGSAYATVRVYIYGQLVFEDADVMLIQDDLWSVCSIQWPDGKVIPITDPVTGGHKIAHVYSQACWDCYW